MALFQITVVCNQDLKAINDALKVTTSLNDKRSPLLGISQYLRAIAGGARAAKAVITTGSGSTLVLASNTITITHANVAAADTITIGGVVLTARASGAVANEWNIGANATADGVALAACINSYVPGVLATANTGVVTVTSDVPGEVGNLITLATSKPTAFAFGGGISKLRNGAGALDSASKVYSYGIA
jgi:hypothetical protein